MGVPGFAFIGHSLMGWLKRARATIFKMPVGKTDKTERWVPPLVFRGYKEEIALGTQARVVFGSCYSTLSARGEQDHHWTVCLLLETRPSAFVSKV